MKRSPLIYLMMVLLLALTGCGGAETPEETPTTIPTPEPTLAPTAVPTPASTSTPTIQAEPPDDTAVDETPTPTASVAPCQKPPGWINYSIRPGDTLFSLGQATDSSVQEIMTVNCLTSDRILAGQPIFLPKEPNIQLIPTVTDEKPDPVTPSPEEPTPSPIATAEQGPAPTPSPSPTPLPTATAEQGPAPGPGDPRLEILPFSGSIPTHYTATLEEYNPNQTVSIEIYFNQTGALVLSGAVTVDDEGNGIFIFSSEEGDQPGLYTLFAIGEGGSPNLFGEFQIDE